MEREQRTKNTETDKDEREEDLLNKCRNSIGSSDLHDRHGIGATILTVEEVDAKDADDQQRGSSHEHQRQLHGTVLLWTGTPNADEQVHRNQSDLVEHEHGEEVLRDEEAKHTGRQQGEPEEVFLLHRMLLPGGKGSREDDDGRKQDHHHRDAVHARAIEDVQGLEPRYGVAEEEGELLSRHGLARLQKGKYQVDGKGEKRRRTYDHDATHLTVVASQPKGKQHQNRYNDEKR